MEESCQRVAGRGAGEGFRTAMIVYAIMTPAFVAIIVFGEIAAASAPIKLMVAVSNVLANVTVWLQLSSSMTQWKDASKDMTPQERALESGKNLQNQPFAVFQGYAAVITVAQIVTVLLAIYQ